MKHSLFLSALAFALLANLTLAGSHGGGVVVLMYPGSSLQPRKDQVCVAEAVTIGDKIKNSSGDVLIVKSLSGKSAMCKNKDMPILAAVEFSASTSFQTTLSMEIPQGFVAQELGEKEKFDGTRLIATNKATQITIRVQSWERTHHGGIGGLIDGNRSAQAKNGPVAQTAVEEFAVQGVTAARWETETKPWSPLVPHTTFVTTIIEGDAENVFVNVWGPTKNITRSHDEVLAVAGTIVGVGKDAAVSDEAPVSAPQP